MKSRVLCYLILLFCFTSIKANNYGDNQFSVEVYHLCVRETKNGNLITWKTDGENVVSNYVVEKSKDGRVFYPIGSVKPRGELLSQEKYVFIDLENSGYCYYRVKAISPSNDFKYSGTIVIRSLAMPFGKKIFSYRY